VRLALRADPRHLARGGGRTSHCRLRDRSNHAERRRTARRCVTDRARRVLEIIVTALAEADGRPEHVIRTRTYLTDADDWRDVGRADGELFRDVRPATTGVVVTGFIDPRWIVEIDADAILPETR
jgi:enamine deaminase RidA (YjgF/YER057c/UK114 family)